MGHIKNFAIRLHNGGDDAIAAAAEMTESLRRENAELRQQLSQAEAAGAKMCQELLQEINRLREQLARATTTHSPDLRS